MAYGTAGIQLGAPGVYRAAVTAAPGFEPVRLDVTGFVGVAPRGPVDQPVLVESWTQYRWRFGGAVGPGLLGLAVQSFFAQGGERAVVVRVAPRPAAGPAAGPDDGKARLRLIPAGAGAAAAPAGGPGRHGAGPVLELLARDPGAWGDGLRVALGFDVSGHLVVPPVPGGAGQLLELPASGGPPPGSLLRVRGRGLPAAGAFRWLEEVRVQDRDGVRRPVAVLSDPVPDPGQPVELDVVTGTVTVADQATDLPREEVFAGLGLRDDHPLALRRGLAEGSLLVEPGPSFPAALTPPDVLLTGLVSELAAPGADRYEQVGPDSFFGRDDVQLLPVGGEEPVEEGPPFVGVDRMSLVPSIGLLCVPDLLWSATVAAEPAVVRFPAPAPGPRFAPCPAEPVEQAHQLPAPQAVLLDGGTELDEILRRQQRVLALAERQRRFVALLDVPMGLPLRTVARWRAQLDSSYAAAYHPWLGVAPTDAADLANLPPGTGVRLLPPSAAAAGVFAERERSLGLPWGPAHSVAVGAVSAADPVADADADALHQLDVNVFRPMTEGFRLAAAHTLARRDPQYRQLTVRRLMTMLRLVLDRQARWLAFEPNDERLRTLLRAGIVQLLRDLFRAGAFQGGSEEEAFFVQCDDALNPPYSQGLGRLVAEIGVAPSTPLEYLVLRIARRTDTGLTVEG
ncbi:MAG TPA: phage tail sheath C-terminal domain-containing protein [Actinomycetes bacterium]